MHTFTLYVPAAHDFPLPVLFRLPNEELTIFSYMLNQHLLYTSFPLQVSSETDHINFVKSMDFLGEEYHARLLSKSQG